MESQEIIGSINDIYERFAIPPWLQLHMLRAGAVSNIICDSLSRITVNARDVVASTLIHDLGNIIKSNLDTNAALMGSEAARLDYWKSVKAETIAKYGGDEHIATVEMAKSIGASPRVIRIIENIGVPKIEAVGASADFEQKISSYSDLRVGPFGILSLRQRFEDFRERYKGRAKTLTPERFEIVYGFAQQLENEVLNKTSLKQEQINDRSIEPYILKYKQKIKSI
ncbi:MAG: hypothetical protein KGI04_02890 [Candidatus Micrarchaeota archaeon]|nr:hypothetical protein [Candidatus Micrarchaeota archaeon]